MSQLSLFNLPEELQVYAIKYLTETDLYNLCISSTNNKKKIQDLSLNFTITISTNIYVENEKLDYFVRNEIRIDFYRVFLHSDRIDFRINPPVCRALYYWNECCTF